MRTLICGGRDFTDRDLLFATLDALAPAPTLIIEGGQRTRDPVTREIIGGADYWAMRWAASRHIEFVTCEANWRLHGRAAGAIRNRRMLRDERPERVIAFRGGPGTQGILTINVAAGGPGIKI